MKKIISFLFLSFIGSSLHANELPIAFICDMEILHKYPSKGTGVTVSFDGSCSSDADSPEVWNPKTREYIYDGMSYRWIFPAGATTDGELLIEGASVSVQFIKPGRHQVTLWVKDRDGGDATINMHIIVSDVPTIVFPPRPHPQGNFPPIADAGGPYVAGITSLGDGGEVQFSGDAFDFDELVFDNNQHLQYGWDFGNGCHYNVFLKDVFDIRGNRTTYPDGEAIFYDGDGSIKTNVDWDTNRFIYTVDPGTSCRSTGKKTTHVFTKPGTYNVKLTVVDKYYPNGKFHGNTTFIPPGITAAFTTVFVNQIPKISKIKTQAGILFPRAEIRFKATVSELDKGQNLRLFWDFGDGNTASQGSAVNPSHSIGGTTVRDVVHTYDKPGSYVVSLIATDGYHTSAVFSYPIEISFSTNQAPHADFKVLSDILTIHKKIGFYDLSYDPDGQAHIRTWDWGDGNSYITPLDYGFPQYEYHQYNQPGTYVVTLTVTDELGVSSTTSKTIEVSSSKNSYAPSSVFNIIQFSPFIRHVYFKNRSFDSDEKGSNLALSDYLSISWDFGDGNTSNETNPMHLYAKHGTYVVTLTVSDGDYSSVSKQAIQFRSRCRLPRLLCR